MSVRWKRVLIAAAAVMAVAAAALAPRLLRGMDAFRVRNVAVTGLHYLRAEDAVAASRVTRTENIFDDPAPWIDALRRHPLVAEATIERQLPGTLVFHVIESRPVALVDLATLSPADARGRLLPIASTNALDLPILRGGARTRAGQIIDVPSRRALAVLARIEDAHPRFAARVSEAVPEAGGVLRLVLRDPAGADALVGDDADARTLDRVRAALADLSAKGELVHLQRIDARFADQIVVRLNESGRPPMVAAH